MVQPFVPNTSRRLFEAVTFPADISQADPHSTPVHAADAEVTPIGSVNQRFLIPLTQ